MNAITPVDAVAVLNRALRADPSAIQALFRHRVICNEALTEDPTIQVRGPGYEDHQGHISERASVSVLGLINGIFGVSKSDGCGFIEAVMDEGVIEKFVVRQILRRRNHNTDA